ncbi:hypothetical protein M5005_Spy0979 [Streptococcus pyogenes MGAS5005]|uniref:Uncharacterized protein n=2 Tax=Streptococcus pyogenes TaxID=1314 RepID=A0A0H2UUV0_STRP3|nr:hypothetical protein SpyM3_0902 [Streptococcus pyogenes MGAS315]AAT87102.1 Hypothetical protein M6_Spy0968 [Streptococcus pyogenes MGAS10394]AAX72064.1 hypothetical protein M28_Spy0951 [Streptococcus pyogenes MGAS6180]AAZ51597.1 hypothetical protein M5005_Spy0979 [Streptococcus pyogenes MGAS5005]ABF32269.1 hypothetical protein MGAS9429_Spy1083 [Streptococcus pyogenes MGAS9429]ABF34157.1 hypothetical protein MGAS10270_Spy1093 [Streptococcus pyogenes MGAS10270]ABF36089.1 hypothetical protein
MLSSFSPKSHRRRQKKKAISFFETTSEAMIKQQTQKRLRLFLMVFVFYLLSFCLRD